MPDFVWEARSRAGEVRKGVMSADSVVAVEQRLRQQGRVGVRNDGNAFIPERHFLRQSTPLLRPAERQFRGSPRYEPPRRMRNAPLAGPCGSLAEPLS